jgi:hypothetical protein
MRIVAERFRLRRGVNHKARRRLALCGTLRDTAHVARRVRTGAYPQDARWRLADAVKDAREAAGYPTRPAFYRAAGIGKRSLENVESKEPGAASVGEVVLHAIGRALPNWTKDTPQIILEGGPIPPLAKQLAEPHAIDAVVFEDLDEVLTVPHDAIVQISKLVEKVSGPEAAEKFLFDALSLRRQHNERRDIEPDAATDRDVS